MMMLKQPLKLLNTFSSIKPSTTPAYFTSKTFLNTHHNFFDNSRILSISSPKNFSSFRGNQRDDDSSEDNNRKRYNVDQYRDYNTNSKKKPNWRQRRDKILREFFFPVGSGRHLNERSLNEIREQLESHPQAHLGVPEASSKMRLEDLNMQRQLCTAYCTAEAFDFDKLYLHLAKMSPSVTLTSPMNSTVASGIISRTYGDGGEVFYFEDGSVICWGTSQDENEKILNELQPFEINRSKQAQTETIDWVYGDKTFLREDLMTISRALDDKEITRHKLAFSYGLHQSVRLAFLEERAEYATVNIQGIPDLLASSTLSSFLRGRTKRQEVKKQLADVLKLRGHINLYSELLETPDLFWDEPNLENIYELISKNLEISKRIAVVNKRLDYSTQVIEVYRDQLSQEHSTRLEWLIIVLIAIEVVQGMLRLLRNDDNDNDH